jgi:hypothetical protein
VRESQLEPLEDPVAEARRIVAAAEGDLLLRVMGGVAVGILCPSAHRPPLARSHQDIDLATTAADKDNLVRLMESIGYTGDKEFNMLHGHSRLHFWDGSNSRYIDVFVDEADLCHRIDLRNRLEAVPLTLSPADLAVLKLQVVETNEKDYLDICALFADHDLGGDENGINSAYIAKLAASDWGLWRTIVMVLERSRQFALRLPGFEARERVADRLQQLQGELERFPKSRSWKLRARIGERKRWYQLPEEID